jgi:hypothetical protein
MNSLVTCSRAGRDTDLPSIPVTLGLPEMEEKLRSPSGPMRLLSECVPSQEKTNSQSDDSRNAPTIQDGMTAFSRRGYTTHQPKTIDHFLSKPAGYRTGSGEVRS